jgi:hypothetical protein
MNKENKVVTFVHTSDAIVAYFLNWFNPGLFTTQDFGICPSNYPNVFDYGNQVTLFKTNQFSFSNVRCVMPFCVAAFCTISLLLK